MLREAQSGKSPADVLTMVEAARKVITWLDWSGGLPCIGGESMAVDVKSLSFAVDEFDSEELLRKAAALTATRCRKCQTILPKPAKWFSRESDKNDRLQASADFDDDLPA